MDNNQFKKYLNRKIGRSVLEILYEISLENTEKISKTKTYWIIAGILKQIFPVNTTQTKTIFDEYINNLNMISFFRYIKANILKVLGILFIFIICCYYGISYLYLISFNIVAISLLLVVNTTSLIYFVLQAAFQDWRIIDEHLRIKSNFNKWSEEEYELQRNNLGWRLILERINHDVLIASGIIFFMGIHFTSNVLLHSFAIFHVMVLIILHFYIMTIAVSIGAILIDNQKNKTLSFRIFWFFMIFVIGLFMNILSWSLFVFAMNTSLGIYCVSQFGIIYALIICLGYPIILLKYW